MQNRASNFITGQVPANGIQGFHVKGASFYLLRCAGPVFVRTDNTPEKPYLEGTGEDFPADFSRLEIRNPTAEPISFSVWYGWGRYIDTRSAVYDGYTETAAHPVAVIPGNTSWPFLGSASGNRVQRKALVVSNLDPAIILWVCDGAGNKALACFPQQSAVIQSAGPLVVKNEQAAPVNCAVSEVWYTAR